MNKLFEFMHETHPGVQVTFSINLYAVDVITRFSFYAWCYLIYSVIDTVVTFPMHLFQDMACDTFLKIVQKCKRKFVIVQVKFSLCMIGKS